MWPMGLLFSKVHPSIILLCSLELYSHVLESFRIFYVSWNHPIHLYVFIFKQYFVQFETLFKIYFLPYVIAEELVIPPGHFLSVRNCQNTLVSATLEDE